MNSDHKVQTNRDREPDQLASISVSRDEIAARRPASGTSATVRRPAPVEGGSKQPWLLWALMVICLAAIGYLMVQNQRLQGQSDKQVAAIAKLQAMLTSTDEQASLSVDAIKILLREQDSEIRKLWDLANKRNKKDIAKNKETLDDQAKLITRHSGKFTQLDKSLSAQEKSTKQIGDKLSALEKELAESVAAMQVNIEKSQLELEQLSKNIPKSLDKDVKSLSNEVKSLDKEVNKVGSNVASNAKSIKAIDATRLQHNRRIKALESELKALKQAQGGTP